MKKTIRLVIAQWQGGVNPDYAFGAKLLSYIAPESPEEKTFTIRVHDFEEPVKDGDVVYENNQLQELEETAALLKSEKPDRIIIFGGDCSVSQGPFDYLSALYGSSLGLIWLDTHPDISTARISEHNHEFILASIMGKGESAFSKAMNAPIPVERVIYAGLVEDSEEKMKALGVSLSVITPEQVKRNPECIKDWIKKQNLKQVCIRFDLDVLSPESFRSLTSSKPFQTKEEYGAAIGELNLNEVVKFLQFVQSSSEIVGLSIAEYMPWDAIHLREALSKLNIFEES